MNVKLYFLKKPAVDLYTFEAGLSQLLGWCKWHLPWIQELVKSSDVWPFLPFTSAVVPVALGSSTAGEEDWGFSPAQQSLRAVVLPLFELSVRQRTKLWHLTILRGRDGFRSWFCGGVSSVIMAQSRADALGPGLAAERLEMKHLTLHFPSPQKAVKAWTHLCLQRAWFC